MEVIDHGLYSEMVGPGSDDGQGVRVDVAIYVEHVVLVVLELSVREKHRQQNMTISTQQTCTPVSSYLAFIYIQWSPSNPDTTGTEKVSLLAK